jgi:uncharacterized protein (DUF1778 family)
LQCTAFSRTLKKSRIWHDRAAQSPAPQRIEARIAPKALDLIERAAEAKGSSVSDFVVVAARDAAARELEEQNIIRLSAHEQRKFVALLLDPTNPNKALKRAATAHKKLIKR